jgi:hypothetical protein
LFRRVCVCVVLCLTAKSCRAHQKPGIQRKEFYTRFSPQLRSKPAPALIAASSLARSVAWRR